MTKRDQHQTPRRRSDKTIAIACAAFFFTMIGVAYASVPLYQLFCQVTGYGGTTQRVEQYSDTVLDREITVRFDANISGGLPWEFQPKQRDITIKIGETAQVAYEAKNPFSTPSAGTATFNVTPQIAGSYFNKVECFCFSDTMLQAGDTLDMPVVFFVDPAIVDDPDLKNIKTITLSYTFFPTRGGAPLAADQSAGRTDAGKAKQQNLGG